MKHDETTRVLARRFAEGPTKEQPNARALVYFEVAAEGNLPAQIGRALAVYDCLLRRYGRQPADDFSQLFINPPRSGKR